MEDSHNILTSKMNYLFFQFPRATVLRSGQEFLEKWCYAVRNLAPQDGVPKELLDGDDGAYFRALDAVADRSNIRNDYLSIYDNMIRDDIQIRAERAYAVEEAIKEGLAKGREEGEIRGLANTALKMKSMGLAVELIAEATGLSIEEISML